MKIGVRAHDFGRQSPGELAGVISGGGFETVQLAITKAIEGIGGFQDITGSLIKTIGESFAKHNLEIAVLGCYIEPSIPDEDKRLTYVDWFKQGLEQAKALGVSVVGTETTHFDSPDEGLREERYALLKDSVLRMVEKAEKENVTVGIEPVAEHTLNTPQLTRRLLDEVKSDKLKVIFDPVNLLLPDTAEHQTEIFQEAFRLFGREIVVLHMKDIVIQNGQKEWRNIGKGIVNYPFLFQWLNLNKPDIPILREHAKMDSYVEDIRVMEKLKGESQL